MNAIITSDLHIGSRYFLFQEFERFVRNISEDYELILNGDVIDNPYKKLTSHHQRVFDLIKQVGPGGNFVTAKHTRQFMRSEHYYPSLSDRNSREDWEKKGAKTSWERAADRVKEVLSGTNYSLPPEIRNKVITEIEGIVD